jgi:signal transduction histidine kinase
MPFRSVGSRLALALLVIVTGVLAIVYVIVVPSFQHSLQNEELRSLSSSLQKVALPAFPAEFDLRAQYVNEMAPAVDARVAVLDALSETVLEPMADSNLDQRSSDLEEDPVALLALRRAGEARGIVHREGEEYAEVASPAPNEPRSVVLLSSPLRAQLQTVGVVRRRLLIAGAVSTVFAVLVGYAAARLFARRLRRLEQAAERIAAGNFEEPVVDAGRDEVGQLARGFERMRLRLSRLDRARGEFIANASHELRTPLFSLSGFLELLEEPELDPATREEFLVSMREQVARLAKLATDLLDLSRLDAGRLTPVSETVDLAGLAAELTAEFTPRAAATGQALEVV